MMFRSRLLSRTVAGLAFLGAIVLAAELSRTDAQQAGKGQERLNYDEKLYKAKANDIKGMFQGDVTPDKKVLDLAAQHYAYRLTDTALQSKKGGMPALVKEATDLLISNRAEDRKSNEAIPVFNTMLLAHLKEVLANPRPIASINAAVILAHMAELGQEAACDALSDALNDKDMNGGTKLWAARGLYNFFMLGLLTGDAQPITFKDKERGARCVQALLASLEMKLPQTPPPTPEEIEGLRYLRGEVIKALGASRYPAVADAKGAIQGRTAQALCRVLRNDGFNPAPRLDEQVNAAIGLCQLKMKPSTDYKLANDYQLDVAAYHLGRFFVDLARQHQNRKELGKAQAFPWKTTGARLGVALGALSGEVAVLKRQGDKVKNSVEYVSQIITLSSPILKAIEADGSAQADRLAEFLESKPRDNEPIYKGDDASVIKPNSSELKTEPGKDKKQGAEKKEKKAGEEKKQ